MTARKGGGEEGHGGGGEELGMVAEVCVCVCKLREHKTFVPAEHLFFQLQYTALLYGHCHQCHDEPLHGCPQ